MHVSFSFLPFLVSVSHLATSFLAVSCQLHVTVKPYSSSLHSSFSSFRKVLCVCVCVCNLTSILFQIQFFPSAPALLGNVPYYVLVPPLHHTGSSQYRLYYNVCQTVFMQNCMLAHYFFCASSLSFLLHSLSNCSWFLFALNASYVQ